MRRFSLLSLILLGGCTSCASSPPPTAASVYSALVNAGCLAASDGGEAAVAAEEATGHDAWMTCLFDGGTVASCNVPCDASSGRVH